LSSTVTINGTSYAVPSEGDSSWATDVSNLLIALATSTKVLQTSSSTFTLTAEVDFGATYGLKAAYLKSRAANPASAGILRLANAESIKWRNQANNADLDLTVNSSNVLQFNGANILSAGAALIVNADVSASAAIAYSKLNLSSSIVNADVSNSAAIAYSKLNLATSIVNADISASAAIAYSKLNLSTSIVNADVSGSAAIAYSKLNLATSIVNADISASAAIAYSKLNIANNDLTIAKTNGLQTALDSKVDKSTLTTKGDLYVATASATIARQGIGSDGQILVADSSQTNGLKWSTISGGVNYILNPGAEASTTGWATYADAAAVNPVDGTGGSPNSTWTRSTSSPLHGSGMFILTHNSGSSRQGEGASYDFSIDAGDKAKVLQIEFDYQLVSGTFTAGSDSVTSDLTVWIYDVTNSTLIQPSTYKLFSNSSTLPTKFVSNFQSASNSTSYRVIIHCGSTSTSAFVMSFDDFKVAPCSYVYGTPITDWVAWTPTGSWVTNTTYTGFKRRVGDTYEYQVIVITSGAPTATSLLINIQETMDTSKLPSTNVKYLGEGMIHDNGTDEYKALVQYNGTSQVFVRAYQASGTYVNFPAVNATSPMTWTNTDSLNIRFSAPIVGLSSSVQMSDSYDGRQIGFRANNSATSINSTPAKIVWTNTDKDDVAGYSSGTYTVRSPGWYNVKASLYISGTPSVDQTSQLYIYRNGANIKNFVHRYKVASATTTSVAVADLFYFNSGDTIEIYASSEITSAAISSSTTLNTVSINKSTSSATISATEVVAAIYNTSSQALGSGTEDTIIFTTKELDTHGCYSTSTGLFTAPVAGIYQVSASGYTGAKVNATYDIQNILAVNSTNKAQTYNYNSSTTVTHVYNNVISKLVTVNAGDTIRFKMRAGSSGYTLDGNAERNYISIHRIK